MTNYFKKNKLDILAAILIIFFAIACFYKLGSYKLFDFDEATYAEVSRNILRGHFSPLAWFNRAWFEKPPLFFLLQAVTFKIFGISPFTARLISAVSGIVLACVTYKFSQKLFNKKVAFLTLLLLVCNTFILFYSRFATTDILLTTLSTISLYFFWLSQENKKYLYLFALFVGLAVMTKGPAGLPPAVIAIIYLIITRQFISYVKNKHFWLSLLLSMLVILPWHIYMLIQFGRTFWYSYFEMHILLRAQTSLMGTPILWYYYIATILKNFPIILVLLFGLMIPKKIYKENFKQILFIIIWLIVSFLSAQLIRTQLEWYVLPAFIPLTILAAFVFYHSFKQKVFLILPFVGLIMLTLLAPTWAETQWGEIKINDASDNCLIGYKNYAKDPNGTYYLQGFYWPGAVYYLAPKNLYFYSTSGSFYGFNTYEKLPKGMMALVIKGKTLPEQTKIIKDLDGCKIIEGTN